MRCAAMNRVIRLPFVFWVVVLLLLFAAKVALAEPYKADPGPHEIETFRLDLQDKVHDRTVPIKIYLPTDINTPRPTVLVSHGLGGSREGLSYLGNHLASHGYACVHLQHPGSDESVWKGLRPKDVMPAMGKAANNPKVAIDRANDVPFVLDELVKLNGDKTSPLYQQIDFERVGIAGHSFGAWSAMTAGGLTLGSTARTPGQTFSDPRIKCIVPLSPPVAKPNQRERAYATLNVPALFMTGTLDTSPINNTTAEERLIPYSLMPGPSDGGAHKYMINFDGADHMTFSGEIKRSLRSKVSTDDNKAFHSLILQATTAFLDCYLLGDQDAKTWLNDGGFAKLMEGRGEVVMDVH